MTDIGYTLISEEHGPTELVDNAVRAEEAGFEYLPISDHFHPWIPQQGEAPFVWSVLGGLARETDEVEFGTFVTCPIQRIHPALVAQAAATTADLADDRFFLGVGTGEKLNEHIVDDSWPPFHVRMEMLEEAVDVIRSLWTGENVNHRGEHFTVDNAKLFTLPDEAPPLYVSGTGPKSARKAGEIGDGLISTAPDDELIEAFQEGSDGPRYGQVDVSWAPDEDEAREIAHEWWPTAAVSGEMKWELPMPIHFEQATEDVTEDEVAEAVTCGPDADDHIEAIEEYVDAGYTHVSIHQVGPRQEGFIDFYESEVLPSFS